MNILIILLIGQVILLLHQFYLHSIIIRNDWVIWRLNCNDLNLGRALAKQRWIKEGNPNDWNWGSGE